MLADQEDAAVGVERHDPEGEAGEMDDAVDATSTGRSNDLIVPERQPVISVRRPP